MDSVSDLIDASGVHDEWREILQTALSRVDPAYLDSLLQDDSWLPGADRLLAAFRRDRSGLRYLLIGESPYPRAESANGIAFYDAAVGNLWSDSGLATAVNRATSLRNIVKTALLAEGLVEPNDSGRVTQQAIAGLDKDGLVQSLADLFANLELAGFLLLNATPVLHPARKPAQEARFWHDFLDRLLNAIADQSERRITLVLWGKIAALVEALPASSRFEKLICEHPYNVSFIGNPAMLELFAQLQILRRRPATGAG